MSDINPKLPEQFTKTRIMTLVPKIKGLTSNQRKAIKLTVLGLPPTQIAEQINVTLRTLDMWHQKTNFKTELEQAKLQSSEIIQVIDPLEIDKAALRTIHTRIMHGDGKIAAIWAAARGILEPKQAEKEIKPFTIQFGTLAKDKAEVEDVLREDLPPAPVLEPEYRPGAN